MGRSTVKPFNRHGYHGRWRWRLLVTGFGVTDSIPIGRIRRQILLRPIASSGDWRGCHCSVADPWIRLIQLIDASHQLQVAVSRPCCRRSITSSSGHPEQYTDRIDQELWVTGSYRFTFLCLVKLSPGSLKKNRSSLPVAQFCGKAQQWWHPGHLLSSSL